MDVINTIKCLSICALRLLNALHIERIISRRWCRSEEWGSYLYIIISY